MSVNFVNAAAPGNNTKFAGPMGNHPQGYSTVVPTSADTSSGVSTQAAAIAAYATNGSPSPLVVLAGFALLLVGLKFLSEHEKVAIEPADFHVGAYNILAVTVTAILGIASLKLLFNSVHVPGITPLVNFV